MRRFGSCSRSDLFCVTVLALGILGAAACDDDDPAAPDLTGLEFTVSFEPATLTLGSEVTITVAAKNPTDEDVYLGAGSSSCALGAVVTYDGADHPLVSLRDCTADMSERWLRAGETRTESLTWAGEIWLDDVRILLPAGSHEVAGQADKFVGEPVVIVIKEALPPLERLAMAISVDEASPAYGATMQVTVAATNVTDERIAVAAGSCVLHGKVVSGRQSFMMHELRICTRDIEPRFIDPGATLTQVWDWTGDVFTPSGGDPFTLLPGPYDIVGTTFSAGDIVYESDPLEIELQEPPGSPASILMTISVDEPTLAAGETATVAVSATNITDVPVRIDYASCMFGAMVLYEGEASLMDAIRICFMAPGSRYIPPGETWNETWEWGGRIRLLPDGGWFTLPPGSYETYSVAEGPRGPFTSESILVEIVE